MRLSLYPSYRFNVALSLYCSCRKSVPLVFKPFSETAVLYGVVVLVSMTAGELRIFLLRHLEL